MKVRVFIAFDVELPNDEEERVRLYGVADPGECVLIDLGNDPAACMMEWDSTVTGHQVIEETR